MTAVKLPFGKSLPGLLVDGIADTPYAGSTLHMEEPSGAVVEVPYLQDASTAQFDSVQEWFSTRTPPRNMLLKTAEGDVSLFDVQWVGHSLRSGHRVSVGKLRPNELVLARRNADLASPLLMAELRSEVDGLREWSRFTAIDVTSDTNEANLVRKLTVEVESKASFEWQQGKVKMALRLDWHTASPGTASDPSFSIFDRVVLDSKFTEPVPFVDHLAEQQKVVHLLVLIFGGPIHFRKHLLRDEAFTVSYGGERPTHHPFVELISHRTVHEYAREVPSKAALQQPLVRLGQLAPDSLSRWATEHENWKRFIVPAAGILAGRDVFVEDLVISLSIAMEAGGQILGNCAGEETTYRGRRKGPTTATYVYRCLRAVDVDWGDRVVSEAGLAQAAADCYNAIKHFDRGELPGAEQTYLISRVLTQVARKLPLNILDPSRELIGNARRENTQWRIHQLFKDFELCINDDGTWQSQPESKPKTPPAGITLG